MALKVHHLNCATMCPHGGRLISGEGSLFAPAELCCHCLLIETAHGLVLVDTGLGSDDVRDPSRLAPGFTAITRPKLRLEETALHRLGPLGFKASDVRHIVVTHLDLDHAGGLPDFPEAQVHLWAPELRAAEARATIGERARYRPAHFAHGPRWAVHAPQGERWLGFDSVQALPGSADRILLIPLPGHTRGHCGVAVETGSGWLLHCGDAYFFRGEVEPQQPYCPPGLRLFQALVQIDGAQRRANQRRLLQLAREHGGEVRMFCAHDPVELARLAAAA